METQGNQPPQGESAPKRIVKRYSNRKLYDTRESRYVTLLQIAEMVRSGEEVQIIDNATKDDLTEVTLAQIIYEEQKQHNRAVPLATLRDLIHQRGERLMSQLREGPLGRLLPGETHEGGEVVAEEHQTYGGTPAKEEKKTIIDQLELLHGKIDERVRSVLTSFSPIEHLQAEVTRLSARVAELEAKLPSGAAKADKGSSSGGSGVADAE